MPAYGYERIIKIGGVDFSAVANTCDFTWNRDVGCETATISIQSAQFDDLLGIKTGDAVSIEFSSGVSWWQGIVVNVATNLVTGLTIDCAGIVSTLLAETPVRERFGSEVIVPYVTSLAATVVTDAGNLGAGYHKYFVTAFDSQGERASSNGTTLYPESGATPIPSYDNIKIEANVTFSGANTRAVQLTWAADSRVTKWRVYKQLSATQQTQLKGAGNASACVAVSPTTSGVIVRYKDVTEAEFIDDGSFDWQSAPTATLPIYDTCKQPSIVSETGDYTGGQGKHSARSAARYLVATHFPTRYEASLITAGADTPLLNIDFAAEDSNLAEALQTLADFVGGVVWGVNEDGKVFFVDRTDSSAEGVVVKEFVLGAARNEGSIHDPTDTQTDVLLNCTRKVTRDGATTINAIPSEKLKAKGSAQNLLAAASKTNDKFATANASDDITNTANACRLYLPEWVPDIPDGVSADAFFSTYANADEFEADYPGMNWLWRLHESGAGDWDDWLTAFIQKLRADVSATTAVSRGGVRRKGTCIAPVGLAHPKELLRAVSNIAAEHTPVIGQWSIVLTNGATLFKPGQGLIAITSLQNVKYVMALQAVRVNFTDSVDIELTCGEPDIKHLADVQRNKVLTKLAANSPLSVPLTGAGGFLTIEGRVPATAIGGTAGRAAGVSNIPAAVDHEHALDPEPINVMMNKDGTVYPTVQRNFVASDLAQLDDFTDSAHADYKRGLAYRDGDLATVGSGDATKRYTRANNEWRPITGAIGGGVSAASYLGEFDHFPAIPSEDGSYEFYHTTDHQLWKAHGGDSVWTALQRTTTLDGVPA